MAVREQLVKGQLPGEYRTKAPDRQKTIKGWQWHLPPTPESEQTWRRRDQSCRSYSRNNAAPRGLLRLARCAAGMSTRVRFSDYSFGSVRVDGVAYDHDLIIDRGKIRKRKKAASRKFRDAYGHTPLTVGEDIPWRCRRLVIGTGANGALPVTDQIREEARRRDVELVALPTAQAIGLLAGASAGTNAILHLTC